jgi:hypothetical protein
LIIYNHNTTTAIMPRLNLDTITQLSFSAPPRHRTTSSSSSTFSACTMTSPVLSPASSPVSGVASPATTVSPMSSPRLRPVSCYSPFEDTLLDSKDNINNNTTITTTLTNSHIPAQKDRQVCHDAVLAIINSVMAQQPSIAELEEERRSFGNELGIFEPRPIVYWGSVEERMRG